ncbi:efflux RND transporter periplasmic adaptor subunit [Chloroflexota bacterium]
MRLLKIVLITLVLCTVGVFSPSCASESAPTPEGQAVTVQRGNLRTDITSVGNLALSDKVDLAFEIPGYVEEVLVKEGDSVEEGQLLAKLDTSAWDDQVTAAERTVTAKERAVTSAERNVTSRKLALLKAQIDLNSAQLALEKIEETSTDRLEIEMKELGLEKAKGDLEAAQIEVADAQIAVSDAKTLLEDAQEALAEAKDTSPEVKAPFAGLITKVNVAGGDEVKKGTVAVTLANPNNFGVDILVSEVNILKLTVGDNATARLDAVPGMALPAKVTYITPSATIQSGVVNYEVTVELQSPQAVMQNQQQARGSAPSDNSSIGRQQPQRQRGQTGQPGGQQPQEQAITSQVVKLREGLTVTISTVMEERNDVLLVPVGAITSRGREILVQVLKDGVTEERSVQTGLSDGQYTEVTEGLSEGETVVSSQDTTTTTSQQGQQSQRGVTRQMQRILR